MTAYIHVGAPKCGSTTLQSIMGQNVDAFLEAGISVQENQDYANSIAHKFAVGWLSDDELVDAKKLGQKSDLTENLDTLLSSETFLIIGRHKEVLRELIQEFGDEDIRILGVVRDPASLLESTWFQWFKTFRKFKKVEESMNLFGTFFRNYLDSGWFEEMDISWRNWCENSNVSEAHLIRMGVDTFYPYEILNNFVDRPVNLRQVKIEKMTQ